MNSFARIISRQNNSQEVKTTSFSYRQYPYLFSSTKLLFSSTKLIFRSTKLFFSSTKLLFSSTKMKESWKKTFVHDIIHDMPWTNGPQYTRYAMEKNQTHKIQNENNNLVELNKS